MQQVIIVECFVPKVIMVVTFMTKIPVMVLMFLLVHVLCNVAHLLGCFINLLLNLKKPKHLLFALFNLFMDIFEVVDLMIELIILWYRANSHPLLAPCL
jgi:hypothetical protein